MAGLAVSAVAAAQVAGGGVGWTAGSGATTGAARANAFALSISASPTCGTLACQGKVIKQILLTSEIQKQYTMPQTTKRSSLAVRVACVLFYLSPLPL